MLAPAVGVCYDEAHGDQWEIEMEQIDVAALQSYRDAVRQRIRELEEQIRPLSQELSRAGEELRAIETLLSLRDSSYPARLVRASAARAQPSAAEAGVSVASVADAAYEALAAAGMPMHYRDLYATMLKRGASVRGKDPAANVIAHINVDPRFTRVSRGTYALEEWDKDVSQEGG